MKPSHAKMLEEADIVFLIVESIETSLEEPLESIAKSAEVVEFMEVETIAKLKFRLNSNFQTIYVIWMITNYLIYME